MFRTIALLASLMSVGLIAQDAGSSSADVRELTRLESAWNEAHERGDAAALDALWADDLQVAVPKMPVMTKPESLAFFRSGRMTFEQYKTSELQFRVYGDTAVVTGRLRRMRVVNDRATSDDWRFTKVYVRQAGAWKVVAFHASEAAQP